MTTVLVTAPEPALTLAQAKDHLRITHTDQDALLTALIPAAVEWCENYTQRALMRQTWDLVLDNFSACIEIPKPPLISVTAANFTYVDSGGATTQVPEARYTVDTDSTPGRVYLAYSQSWPDIRIQPRAVRLRFLAGYTDVDAIPANLMKAMLLVVESMYDGDEQGKLVKTAELLAFPYRV